MFEWLRVFQHTNDKQPDYAAKTLAAYSRGMKTNSITGVVIEKGAETCCAAGALPCGQIYDPKDAPLLPLPGCTLEAGCHCIYRPVMANRNQFI
jgi:hypothetical protein